MRRAIHTDKGAAPRGPYSQAIVADGPTVYVSAQGPNDPATGARVTGDFRAKAEQVFRNVTTLLEAAGTSWEHAVKVTIILADMANFAEMNELYLQYVREPYPARTTLQSNIGEAEILVDCTAVVPQR